MCNRIGALNDSINSAFGGGSFTLTTQLSVVAQAVVILILNCILVVIFGAYALIFIARYIAIWVIVILSPLAFVAFILPQTKKVFDGWVKQLIEWCWIGVAGGFFLYLSEKVSEVLMGANPETKEPYIDYTSTAGVFDKILPNVVVVVFVVIGFILSMKTGAAGGQQILSFANNAAGKTRASLSRFTGRRIKETNRKIREKTPQGIQRGTQGLMTYSPSWGQGQKNPIGWFKRRTADIVGGTARTIGGGMNTTISGDINEAVGAAADYAKTHNVYENMKFLRDGGRTEAEKMAVISTMIDRKQYGDATNEKIVKSKLTDNEIKSAYQVATSIRNNDITEKIERSNINKNNLINQFALIKEKATANLDEKDVANSDGVTPQDISNGYTNLTQKVMASVKSEEDIRQLQKGWWKEDKLIEAANKFWGGSQISSAGRNLGREFTEAFQNFAEKGGIDYYLKNNNLAAPRFLASSAAQGLGMSPIKGCETIKEINKLKQRYDKSKLSGTDQIIEEIGAMKDRLKELSTKPARTQADLQEIKKLQNLISTVADAYDLDASSRKKK